MCLVLSQLAVRNLIKTLIHFRKPIFEFQKWQERLSSNFPHKVSAVARLLPDKLYNALYGDKEIIVDMLLFRSLHTIERKGHKS